MKCPAKLHLSVGYVEGEVMCSEPLYYDPDTNEWSCRRKHRWTEQELIDEGVMSQGR